MGHTDPLQRAVLELDANVDPGTDGKDTGVFEMVGNLEVQQGIETDYLLFSGQGSTLNAIMSGTADQIGDFFGSDPEETNRAGFHLDLGGGRHTIDLNFNGWEGAEDQHGVPLQWGDTGNPDEVTPGDATGADPLTQMNVLNQYLRIGEFDSRYPHARLRFGEYDENGMYDDYLHVAVRRNNVNRVAEDPISFDGSITLEETNNWTSAIDAIGKVEW